MSHKVSELELQRIIKDETDIKKPCKKNCCKKLSKEAEELYQQINNINVYNARCIIKSVAQPRSLKHFLNSL